MTSAIRTQLYSALVLLATFSISGNSLAADYPLQEKLQQCEAAFEKMHSGDLTQEEAWKMRREHKVLVTEILDNLNQRNHDTLASKDPSMSSEEILDNFIIIGSLLEMLATEDLRMSDEWGYPLNE
jgi:hypothetical protein